MKRFAIVLAVILALGIGSNALARDHGRHDRGGNRGHQSFSQHHGNHGHHSRHGHRSPVVVVRPRVEVYRPVPYYAPPVRVYYPPVRPYCYGHRSAEAEMAIGIGRIVGAAIEMGR